MTQRWTDVVFLHWRYDPAVVQALLPPGVQVDIHDGAAWVALVPFRMERLALAGLPPVPGVGDFPEINVRTYVHSGARRGVWFFSLDIDKLLPTAVARTAYRLPYCYGTAEHRRTGDTISTLVDRRWPKPDQPATARIEIAPGHSTNDDATSAELRHFLTSRWGLISASTRGRLRYAPVDHGPWELRHGDVVSLDESLIAAAGLPSPAADPLVMWSPGVDVRVGLPSRLPRHR